MHLYSMVYLWQQLKIVSGIKLKLKLKAKKEMIIVKIKPSINDI